MMNHLRDMHKHNLMVHKTDTETPNDNNFLETFNFPPRQMQRRAIHIPRYGIFFLLWHPGQANRRLSLRAWVHYVGPERVARQFTASFEMVVNNTLVTYSDYVSVVFSLLFYLFILILFFGARFSVLDRKLTRASSWKRANIYWWKWMETNRNRFVYNYESAEPLDRYRHHEIRISPSDR